jgi:YD repeat-containing protein
MISSTDANNHTNQYVLDGDGKTLKTIFADGSFTVSGYDNQGRRKTSTDQMGLTTTYQYDIFGRLTGVVLPPVADPRNNNVFVNPTTTYSYDIYGDMTQITDAIANNPGQSGDTNRVTKFTFDQFGHQMTHTLPMGQSESSTYDSFGRLYPFLEYCSGRPRRERRLLRFLRLRRRRGQWPGGRYVCRQRHSQID